ncbi:MAG: hypothetical protein M3Z04_04990 [Chloroflexota bacterium]|nr:hypothetical protein [Chloroflexota bacterium]
MKRVISLIFAVVLMAAVFPLGGARAADEKLTIELKAQNGSDQDGTATITKLSDTMVRVEIQLKNGTTVAQPAHIHKGTCANLDPKPAYPLTNVVNGASETEVNADIENLANQGYAINIHKSAAEVGTYTSCGEIHEMMVGGTIGGTTAAAGSMDAMKNLQTAAHDLVRETTNKDAAGAAAAYTAYHTLFAANEGAIAAKSAATQAKLEDLMNQVNAGITAADWAKASAAATQLEEAVGSAMTMMGGSMSGSTSGGAMSGGSSLPTTGNDTLLPLAAGLALLAAGLLSAGAQLRRRA